MSYPYVNIINSTYYFASGKVSYASAFCFDNDYTVSPDASWTADGRGVCLVTEISAVVETPNGKMQAKPYSSLGTSYSQFAILQTGPDSFEVTRRVSGAEDVVPADYVEPTTRQN
ncbi:MAG: hypothetical protein WAW02_02755 [Sideroxyarcus sp.]